jgi:HTH-type transcriptional regulator/antitoxin HigA
LSLPSNRKAAWKSLADVRITWSSADIFGECTIFNIKGNKYRLIAWDQLSDEENIYPACVNTRKEDGNMTALAVKTPEYARLLAQTLPSVIHTEDENERFIATLEKLERRSRNWSPAEAKLAELLTLLIENFEDQKYKLKAATPIEVLGELMESNGLKQKDLLDVFGAESTVSAVLNGKRDMTREHIKRLSKRFQVSPEGFLLTFSETY